MAEPTRRRLDAPDSRPGLLMGRPFGIPVYVSATWFVVAGVITIWYAPSVERQLPQIGGARYLVAFAFAVLLYGSVLAHELSHSVVARGLGMPVRRITLYMLGGVSEIEREPKTPAREFLVAVAGPLVSLALAGVGFLLHLLVASASVLGVLVDELWIANLLVGVFNLLPGLPLDGGRIMRAAVWRLTRRPDAATVTAGWIGRALAAVVLLAPFALAAWGGRQPSWPTVIWSALISSFIWLGASQSIQLTRIRQRLPRLSARALARRAIPVAPDLPLAEAIRRAGEAQAGAVVVVDHEGCPTGVVNEAAVTAIPLQRRPWIGAAAVARSLRPELVLSADLAGEELVAAVRAFPATEYLLVEPSGEIYGVLAAADIERAFAGV